MPEVLLAVVSMLLSSIALIGAAVSLALQGRQLRANQVQVAHSSQLELMKIGLENPAVIAEIGLAGTSPLSKPHLQRLAREIFAAKPARGWWTLARESYHSDVTSRRQRVFFDVVDEEFQQAALASRPAKNGTAPTGPA
jgi:HAMP domain-containing protein